MLYSVGADLVAVVHLSFIAFVVLGGFVAWKWSRVMWMHVPALVWGAAIVLIGFTCPLTPLEKLLRRRAGEAAYDGGFIDQYLTGVVYPGEHLLTARLAAALLIVTSYAVLLRRRHRGPREERVNGLTTG